MNKLVASLCDKNVVGISIASCVRDALHEQGLEFNNGRIVTLDPNVTYIQDVRETLSVVPVVVDVNKGTAYANKVTSDEVIKRFLEEIQPVIIKKMISDINPSMMALKRNSDMNMELSQKEIEMYKSGIVDAIKEFDRLSRQKV